MAGYMPKTMPTVAEKPMPSAKDQSGKRDGESGEEVHGEADSAAEEDSEHAADGGEHGGFGQKLKEHFALARAERAADADLARALGHRDRHDRHHADAADHQRNRRDDDQREERGLADLIPDPHERVLRDDVEVVRLVELAGRAGCA